MITLTTSTSNVLFSSDESKSDCADVLMTVKGCHSETVTLVGKRGSKFSMWVTFESEKAAICFLKFKSAELRCDVKVFCAMYNALGNPIPWTMRSQF